MLFVSDRTYLSRLYRKQFGVAPNLDRPVGFNEKIIRKILHDRRPLLTLFSDKLRVRDYVRKTAPSCLLPTLYWWSVRPDAMPFEHLPGAFVLKANHGSGWNLIVEDKTSVSAAQLIALARQWLSKDFTIVGRERAYTPIRRTVYAEQLLTDANGRAPPDDYKLFVFGGKVRIIQVDHARFAGHTQVLYDAAWNLIPGTVAAAQGRALAPPSSLARMIEIAEQLSMGVDFVRVDLYDVAGAIYFGELTNSPNKGLCPFRPTSLDAVFGAFMAADDYSIALPFDYTPDTFAEPWAV
jgi:hypothetical protein